MKRGLVLLGFIISVCLVAGYFLIRKSQRFILSTEIRCTDEGATRQIQNPEKWQLWWPGHKEDKDLYSFKNYHYRVNKIMLDGFEATVYNSSDSLKSYLQVLPVGTDSSVLQLSCSYVFSANPFTRYMQYFRLKKMQKNIADLLLAIKPYFEQEEHIYGMKVEQQKVKDSSLVSIKNSFTHYPTTADIYSMISILKEYIQKKAGEESNFPMLNIYKTGAESYEAMVAIPTKWDLPMEGDFKLKKMVLGNILMGEVKGGIYTVQEAEKQLSFYVTDHGKMSPAISFQSLVTNRLQEPDTSKWITRLYYPVFY